MKMILIIIVNQTEKKSSELIFTLIKGMTFIFLRKGTFFYDFLNEI